MMSSVRKLIEVILPSKKIFYRLQELLNSISTNENKKSILISIEKSNRSREYCELTLDQLELIYVLYPKINQSFYECICGNNPIKAYIDFEYMIENNSSIDLDRAIRSCLKILFFYTNNSSKSSINTEIPLSLVLNQFLVLNAYVSFLLLLLVYVKSRTMCCFVSYLMYHSNSKKKTYRLLTVSESLTHICVLTFKLPLPFFKIRPVLKG